MTVDERVRAEEEALLALIRGAGERVPLEGAATGEAGEGRRTSGVRLPAPSALVRGGRRVRVRRRVMAGTAGLAACALIAAGGVALGSGTLRVPELGRDPVGPAASDADPALRAQSVVAAIDHRFGSAGGLGLYRSGPIAPDAPSLTLTYDADDIPDEDHLMSDLAARLKAAGVDRLVWLGGPQADTGSGVYRFMLSRTKPGTAEKLDSTDLGTLSLGDAGRGRWLQVRPGAEDGWLIFGVLPGGAAGIQMRLTGTDVLLPLQLDQGVSCTQETRTSVGGALVYSEGTAMLCGTRFPGPLVQLRIATTDERPPIDAISYLDEKGRSVLLDHRAGQTVVD